MSAHVCSIDLLAPSNYDTARFYIAAVYRQDRHLSHGSTVLLTRWRDYRLSISSPGSNWIAATDFPYREGRDWLAYAVDMSNPARISTTQQVLGGTMRFWASVRRSAKFCKPIDSPIPITPQGTAKVVRFGGDHTVGQGHSHGDEIIAASMPL